MYIIRKEFTFSASHCLEGLPADHPCTNLHGHNYIVTIELKSEKLDDKGFVVDYRSLEPIKKFIDSNLDHKHLNDFLGFSPTAEKIASYIFEFFRFEFPQLSAVEVSETLKTSARYER